jgi:hypothetical protein
VIEQTTRERAARAVALRDQGRTEEARALLGQNAKEINAYLASAPSPALSAMSKQYDGLVTGLAKPGQWNEQRKLLRQMDSRGASVGARY